MIKQKNKVFFSIEEILEILQTAEEAGLDKLSLNVLANSFMANGLSILYDMDIDSAIKLVCENKTKEGEFVAKSECINSRQEAARKHNQSF